MNYEDAGASSANDRRAGEDVPDQIDPEPWPKWREKALTIAKYELRGRSGRLAREATPEDLLVFVARWGHKKACDGFDPARGEFAPRLRTKIRREIQTLEHLCRHDGRSETTDDLSARADARDPDRRLGTSSRRGPRWQMALQVIPEPDQLVFVTVLQVIDQPGRRYLADAAELLERSVDDVTRAWERIVHHVRRAFPRRAGRSRSVVIDPKCSAAELQLVPSKKGDRVLSRGRPESRSLSNPS